MNVPSLLLHQRSAGAGRVGAEGGEKPAFAIGDTVRQTNQRGAPECLVIGTTCDHDVVTVWYLEERCAINVLAWGQTLVAPATPDSKARALQFIKENAGKEPGGVRC
jgi:hypothetical protein